jgi:uncharacterized protein YqhQ
MSNRPRTARSDGGLVAPRDAPIGGQAVLEGVMMRGVSTWAVAVRGRNRRIAVASFPLVSPAKRVPVLRLPIVRGVVALVEWLALSLRALGLSANAQVPDGQRIGRGMWIGTVVAALAFAVVLFFVVPLGLTALLKGVLDSSVLFWLVEGIVRTIVFLLCLVLISALPDLRRFFQYHGAEHKVISAYEAGVELTPKNARRFSRLHPRCGTSFVLVVMIVAIFVFAPLGLPEWWLLVLSRILGLLLIAGISYEIVRWARRHRVRAIMWPGMQLQKLTTREPDAGQLAVAIAALNAVLEVERPGQRKASDIVGVEVVA